MQKLSAILIVRDEEKNIKNCLESLRWVDEIVVLVDSRSTDATESIVRSFTENVFVVEWQGYAGTKNFALSKAKGPFILWIDGDEVVTPELQTEIQEVLKAPVSVSGYEIPRLAFFLGRWIRHCGWYPGYVLRLFLKEKAHFNELLVHEGVNLTGERTKLKNHLLHYTDRDIEHYFKKYNSFTTLAAQQLADKKRRFRVADLIFRPFFTFLKMYFLKFGFLDGLQGFLLCIFSANYVFTKYAKLWELYEGVKRDA
ncbi:glycosyltransferase family 2 protein [candidate division KSB1 bacterium]|nr:glycosyltransferase family 2 protein [candidate division KSB1 bacterium]